MDKEGTGKTRMRRYIYDVSGDACGNAYLLRGTKNLLFDTGMAFCAGKMVQRIKDQLKGEDLDAVFLTHSHYDHVSGVPFIREAWPQVKVMIAPHGKAVLEKASARRVMWEMNSAAARMRGLEPVPYDERLLWADQSLEDGQTVDLGEWHVTALKAPGHTRDCSSFVIFRDDCRETMMLCCETAGVYMDGYGFTPCFLVGVEETLRSIEKMEQVGADILLGIHSGYLDQEKIPDIWERCREDTKRARERMWAVLQKTGDREEQIRSLAQYYWPECIRVYQPYEAYAVNMGHMLATVEREMGQSVGHSVTNT